MNTPPAVASVDGTRIEVRTVRDDGIVDVALNRSEHDVGGDPRLQAIAHWALRLDALKLRRIRRGHSVTFRVELEAPDHPAPITADVVRPLLLPFSQDERLYPYQHEGVAWLLATSRAILADDMGLGKTAQTCVALNTLVRRSEVRWSMVVAPGSLLANWKAELHGWAPELVSHIATPAPDEREQVWRRDAPRHHVSITSYDHLRAAGDVLQDSAPDLVIADEAHRLRNQDSQIHNQFRGISADRIWMLTGTPIEKSAEDLVTLMSVLEPQRFSLSDAVQHPSSLRSQVRPYILRRTKQDVLDQLPPVIQHNEVLELTSQQRQAYNELLTTSAGKTSDWLQLFSQLLAICDVDVVSGKSSKLDRITEIALDCWRNQQKLVVFSYRLDPLHRLRDRLASASLKSQLVTGEHSLQERSAAIGQFKSDADVTVLLASMRVASEGLTLTEAATVAFINQWWNPSANAQARDRVVRIGQLETVRVYTFRCRGTVEDRIPKILEGKHETFESLVGALAVDPKAQLPVPSQDV